MRKLLSGIVLWISACAVYAQTGIQVEVPNVVAADEQFKITFIMEGEHSPSDFDWSQGEDFQLVWGPQTGQSTSIQIINGKRSKSSQFTYTYILLPKKAGKFTLPAAVAKVKGKEISSGPVSIEVVNESSSSGSGSSSGTSGSQAAATGSISNDDIFLRLTLNRTNVVVGEPIEAVLKLYQRVDIAGFEDARFPDFNGFWSQEVEAPTNIEFRRETLNDRIYNAAVLRKYVLIPQQTGTITIDPAELVCLVNVRVAPSAGASIFDGFFDSGYRTVRKRVTSAGNKVTVSPLPSGAPASFGGGVGSFSISASLSKDSLVTHEAASLIVTVSGRGNVSLLEAPKVTFPPDVESYDTKTSEKIDRKSGGTVGSKTFEYPFIPRSHGDFEIPSVRYSYYDINAKKYVTLESGPIRMSVAKGNDTGGYSPAPGIASPARTGVQNLNRDIRFISTRIPDFSAKGSFFVLSGGFWILTALTVILAAALYFAFRRIAARRADIAGMKNRKAIKMALRRLRQAEEFLRQNLYTAFYEELHKAVLGFVADKLNMSAGELNKDSISEELQKKGVDASLVSRLVAIIDACEFARYSPDSGNEAMKSHYDEAVNVISTIESGMKAKRRKGTGSGTAAAVMLMLCSITSMNAEESNPQQAGQENGDYVENLWNTAVTEYQNGNWEQAAEAFREISGTGLESPELYTNIGDALYKMNDIPHAILYYERALKLDPSYSEARYNLGIATEQIQDRIDPVPEFILKSWSRKLCYTLDSDSWAVLFIVFLAMCLAMVLLFLLGAGPAARRTGFYSGILMLLLAGMSLGFSLWQKTDYMKADSAIVTSPVSAVKSSPSGESAKDLFILHEGTKVRISDEVGEWRNIELADGRQGWMRSDEMEII